MPSPRKLAVLLAALALSVTVVACGEGEEDSGGSGSTGGGQSAQNLSGQLAGAGASSQEAAVQAWIAGVQGNNPDLTISYDPVGSGGGREQFGSGGVQFAGSDSALDDEEGELAKAQKQCGGANNLVQIPNYISPIAVAYNLEGVDNLVLSPSTLAQIMSGKIEQWDDPAIKADNPDAQLPGERITTVHRSDDSGTTENFTEYLADAAPKDWTEEPSDVWPLKGGEAAQGTSGVVDAIKSGQGTVGYADASQAKDLGIAQIKVGDQPVGPTPEAAAEVLSESKESKEGEYVFAYEVERQPKNAGVYPIVLVSYMIACTTYDDPKVGENVKGFLRYVVSPEGQEAAGTNAGSAPITDELRQKIQPAVDAIGGGSGQ